MNRSQSEIRKTELIMESIGTTFINWISYVCNEVDITGEDITYETSVWNEYIPDNFQKLANDITFIIKELQVIKIDIDNTIIIFKHKNNYNINLTILPAPIRNFPYNWGESTLIIKTKLNI